MGEHEHSSIFATGLLCSCIMRSSRGKLFVYVALVGTFFIVMFIFSRTHSNLKELEGVNQKCQQQRDSLSAQLQVVYEHKNRLEKSLQQEKSDHTHTREECDMQHKEMENKQKQEKEKSQSLEKQHSDLKNRYSQLDDDRNILEKKMQDHISVEKQKEEEILKLQTQLNDLLEEKVKLEKAHAAYKIKLQDHMGELNMCRLQYEQMESKLNTARDQMKKLQSYIPTAESPEKLNKASVENKHTVPKINVENAGIYEKLKNGLSNVSLFQDKQVLIRPKINPPDARKSPAENSVLKYSKDVLDINAIQGALSKNSDAPVKTNVYVETGSNKRNSEIQDQENKIIAETNVRNSEIQDQENKIIVETNDVGGGDDNSIKLFHQESLNHPQVQPPHQFEDAGEHGELSMFQQNGMDEQKPQLEQPLNKGQHFSNEIKKSGIGGFLQSNNGLAAPHLQGIMEKHRDDNYVHDAHVHQPFEMPPNVNLVKRDSNHLNNRIADGDDDDDDQEGENEEEQLMGGGPAMRGRGFQDADFDDQDNADNENGIKEEEGVVVAPR